MFAGRAGEPGVSARMFEPLANLHFTSVTPGFVREACVTVVYSRIRVENGSAIDLYSAARAVPLRDLVLGHEAAMAVWRFRCSSACGGMSVYRAARDPTCVRVSRGIVRIRNG